MMWNPKNRRIIVIILAVILAASMVLALLMPVLAENQTDSLVRTEGVIGNDIHVGDVDVSGLTVDEAKAKVNEEVSEKSAQTLTVSANGQTQSIAVSDLGYSWTNESDLDTAPDLGKCGNILSRYKFQKDLEQSPYVIPMTCTVNEDAIRSFVSAFAATADVPATEPQLSAADDGTLQVTAGTEGTVIDQDAAVSSIKDYLLNTWTGGAASAELATAVKEPSVSADDLAKVKDVLGSGETVYAGSTANRSQNIVNGVAKVNGTLVAPGGQFSLIGTVTPFSEDNGYAPAPSYSSGSIVDTYGGGICQVSTTLYMAVLQAELQVDARTNHSMLVGYVTPSMDAAISEEGGKDLVFTNNTDYPIYIMGKTEDGKIDFTIYGVESRDPDRKVTYESKVISQTQPNSVISLDDTVDYGTVEQVAYGHMGTVSELWKHVTVDGTTTDELINSDSYETSPIMYVLGTKGADAGELETFSQAVSAGEVGIATDSITSNGAAVNLVQMPEGSTSTAEAEDSD
jgi:vancomycin resistance protein YoaR